MRIWEVIVIAVGLAMDAFAVSVCKGLAVKKIKITNLLAVGLWFGGFQALMPAIGFFVGSQFEEYIKAYDHWIAFGLLAIIGANMIRESFSKQDDDESKNSSFSFGTMLFMALATSVDALAVGISFACLDMSAGQMAYSAAVIGTITCFISIAGLAVGSFFGSKFKSKAEFAGGVILILIGLKILLEHLGVINF
ncbi:MAG: manganese efflux pump [Clostridia bacterium]|nr:manganese efflux pump [Clostridia bacterium]